MFSDRSKASCLIVYKEPQGADAGELNSICWLKAKLIQGKKLMKSMKIDFKPLIAYWLVLMPKNEFQDIDYSSYRAKSHQLIKCLESGCELKADNCCKIFLF